MSSDGVWVGLRKTDSFVTESCVACDSFSEQDEVWRQLEWTDGTSKDEQTSHIDNRFLFNKCDFQCIALTIKEKKIVFEDQHCSTKLHAICSKSELYSTPAVHAISGKVDAGVMFKMFRIQSAYEFRSSL